MTKRKRRKLRLIQMPGQIARAKSPRKARVIEKQFKLWYKKKKKVWFKPGD